MRSHESSDIMTREKIRMKIVFHGLVQGVGFRWRTRHAADMLGITGYVKNLCDGSVLCEAQGTRDEIDKMIEMLESASYSDIRDIETEPIPAVADEISFEIKY